MSVKRFVAFCVENKRFSAAVSANLAALLGAIWWSIDANLLQADSAVEIEPLVTSVALMATLLGLNYVNEKIGKPLLRFKLEQCVAQPPGDEMLHGMSIELQNHSIYKCHIRRFYFTIPTQKSIYQLLRDGFTREYLKKFSLEPGQSFSFSVERNEVMGSKLSPDQFGDLIVEDDVGRTYVADQKNFKENLRALFQPKT